MPLARYQNFSASPRARALNTNSPRTINTARIIADSESSIVAGCTSISLVGNAIRTILGKLSAALDVFQDQRVHMVTQSANDLNLTLVVDPEHSGRLVRELHRLLIDERAEDRTEFGSSWRALGGVTG